MAYYQLHKNKARQIARSSVLKTLSIYQRAAGQTAAAWQVNRIQFLYLHHVFEDEQANFRALLRDLARHYQFLSYSDAVNKLWQGKIDAPYVVFSLDDGLKNGITAARILEEFGIRACFFVCPSIVGETDFQKIRSFCAEHLHQPPGEFMSWDDLETLAKNGHAIGGHTMRHIDLARVPLAEAQTEIGESFEAIARKISLPHHFAWPYGRFAHCSPALMQQIFQAGFQSCASAERGCHVAPQPDRTSLCIRRDHVIAAWPIEHINVFITRNSRMATTANNVWPG